MDEKNYSLSVLQAFRAGDDVLVVGAVTFPTGGWTAELVPTNEGINPQPELLVLALDVTEPGGGAGVPDVLTYALVHFATEDPATSVEVRGHGTVGVTDLVG